MIWNTSKIVSGRPNKAEAWLPHGSHQQSCLLWIYYSPQTVTHSTSTMLEFSHVTRHTLQARREAKGVPLLAVGTKCDLRDDPNRDDMVSVEQGVEMAIKVCYIYLVVMETANISFNYELT